MDKFYILTTAGEFEVDDVTAADVRAQFDSDRPEPLISFPTTDKKNVEILPTALVGFASSHTPRARS